MEYGMHPLDPTDEYNPDDWEVVAEASGPRGTTYAILREEADGTVRLRDRCAEGLTPDGTAMDAVYNGRMAATWDAARLVDIWASGPANPDASPPPQPSTDLGEVLFSIFAAAGIMLMMWFWMLVL